MLYPVGATLDFYVIFHRTDTSLSFEPDDATIVVRLPDASVVTFTTGDDEVDAIVVEGVTYMHAQLTSAVAGEYIYHGETTDPDASSATTGSGQHLVAAWVNNLDVTISSRLAAADYVPLEGVATVDDLAALEAHGDAAWATADTLDAAETAAAVQTGMTAQGFTPTRAGYLDVLNGLVNNVRDAVWNALSGSYSVVGSMGLLLQQIYSKMSFVGVRTIIASYLDVQGNISIDQGADATITWVSSSYPNLAGATVVFQAEYTLTDQVLPNYTKSIMTSYNPDEDEWTLTLEIPHIDSDDLGAGRKAYRYKVLATLASGRKEILERGGVNVDKAID